MHKTFDRLETMPKNSKFPGVTIPRIRIPVKQDAIFSVTEAAYYELSC